jgi:hypothetical protein
MLGSSRSGLKQTPDIKTFMAKVELEDSLATLVPLGFALRGAEP